MFSWLVWISCTEWPCWTDGGKMPVTSENIFISFCEIRPVCWLVIAPEDNGLWQINHLSPKAYLKIWESEQHLNSVTIFTQLCPWFMELCGSFCASKCSILFCRSRCHHKSSPGAAPFQALNQQKADSLDDYSQVDGNRLSITFGSDQRSCAIMESSFITVKSLDGV